MLDGLLGRGFSVKCKSLIKATRTRIEVVRRRPEAKQRFLKEDLAKLLANGLEINAYGRTEEFLAGMNLLSCYDFIEQYCEYTVKQLSKMQKQGLCPEECREAVASLMFAAARFSDLPELRELRDMFQQRYGHGLADFVNQKFVEKLSSRPPPIEKRLQALQDIALEFSIKWDSRGFEQRMATDSVVTQVDVQKAKVVKQIPGLLDEKKRMHGEGDFSKRDKPDHRIAGEKATIEYREKLKKEESGFGGSNDILFHGRHILMENKHQHPIEQGNAAMEVERSSNFSHGKMLDNALNGYRRPSNGISNPPRKGENADALCPDNAEFAQTCPDNLGNNGNVLSYNSCKNENTQNTIRKGLEEESDKLKPRSNYALPPPYVKSNDAIPRPPYIRPNKEKERESRRYQHAGSDLDGRSIDPTSHTRRKSVNSSGRVFNEPDHQDHDEQFVAPSKAKNYGPEKELDYQDEKILLPKPRSMRRKHHKSASNYNAAATSEDVAAVSSSSISRRKDHSRKGLRILFDEEQHVKDDEEKIIDQLLIHYSQKPSSYGARKLRKKLQPGQPSHQIIADVDESSSLSRGRDRDVHDGQCEVVPPPTRSVSLPHEQTSSQVSKKVFNRAKSFQPDNQARHVHPKLPDYDDLAARFTALRGR